MNANGIMGIFSDTAYVRTGGSPEELKTAEYLLSRLNAMGLTGSLEAFDVDMADILEAELTVDGKNIPCKGYKNAGTATVEAELYYLRNTDDYSLSLCKGKIAMIDGHLGYWRYQDLLANGALGFITYDGNANYTDTERTITNHAVSTGVLFTPWHKLHILGALRYTHWAYDFGNRKTGKLSEYRKSSLVPYLGITFDIDKNHSIYANYTQIKKPQTNRDMDNNLLNPITGTNTEIGFKSDWFGNGRLNSSFALYQIIQKNRPYDLDKRNAMGEWAYQAIGKVQSRGFEAELSGDLTEDWKISANYAFNMSKYKESEGARYPIGTNFSKHTPKHMFRLYTSYRLPFADRKWTIGGGMTVQSKTNSLWDVGQGGYLLWNADVHYTPTKNLNLSLIGSNLGNRRYYENHRIRTMGINNIYGQPRNVMFKVDYKF